MRMDSMAVGELKTCTFLSDVHIGTHRPIPDQGTLVTRFTFTLPHKNYPQSTPQVEQDKDGDMIVTRRIQHVLFIEHAMSTTLEAVGLQVWRGALLMSDYLLSSAGARLRGAVVLELGAGTGLVSIIAALRASHVFCTDTGKMLLELCQRNVEHNNGTMGSCGNTTVRDLDWRHPFSDTASGYSWSKVEMEALAEVTFILASDVVYDNELTDAFFSCLVHLYSLFNKPPTVIISMENRLNFSLDNLEVVSPYYEHFIRCLELSYSTSGGELQFQVQKLPIDFPQHSDYDRVKELELFELNFDLTDMCKGRT